MESEYDLGPCNCIIETLITNPFKNHKLQDKIKIVKLGRPKTDLDLRNVSRGKRAFTRRFRTSLYDSVPWLCGCRSMNKLFCWPCLMFSKEEKMWNTIGYSNLQNIKKTAKIHQCSVSHIIALKELKKFVKAFRKDVNFAQPIVKPDVELYNLQVSKERVVFKQLVRLAGYLGKLGYSLSEPDNDKCNELLKFIAVNDLDVKNLMMNRNNDLVPELKHIATALFICMNREIKREIDATNFVTLIMDTATDKSNTPYIVTSLRYMSRKGSILERFVRFSKRESVTASGVFEHVRHLLNEFGCASKLVAYTHDGAVAMNRECSKLKHNIQRFCPGAIFVHHYAHGMCNIFIQSVCHIAAVKLFFSSLCSIGDFFMNSKKRVSFLMDEIILAHPLIGSIQWNDEVRLVETVFNHKEEFKKFFLSVVNNTAQTWDSDSVRSATNLLILMNDLDFNFFLATFSQIFLRTSILFQLLMNKITEPTLCAKTVNEYFISLRQIKNNFHTFWSNIIKDMPVTFSVKKNGMISTVDNQVKAHYNRIYLELYDSFISCLFERYGNLEEVLFFCLLDNKQFRNLYINSCTKAVNSLVSNYRNRFNYDKLRNELTAIYGDTEFRTVKDIHEYLKNQELDDVFSETFKLSKLMHTLPLTTKILPSVSDRVKNFMRRHDQDLALSCLFTLEREFLEDLLEQDKFIEEVVNEFACKVGRCELLYKGLPKDSPDSNPSAARSSASDFGLDSNLFVGSADSDMVVEVDPTSFMPPENDDVIEIDPLSQPGPSGGNVEPDSSMLEQAGHVVVKTEPDSQSSAVEIKQEPLEDSGILSANVEKELNFFTQDDALLSGENSLFQPPALIKEEPITSEEEM